ncbi:MAG: hypothetical protein K2H37_02900 [Lachnospiraceae bacterium]|nr:hypothetical protein [Lachnospiraceae bacterium]
MCGLVCVTVYAQFFSLFAGVGMLANVILCFFCLFTVLADQKGIVAAVRRFFPAGKRAENGGGATGAGQIGWPGFCAAAVLFLLFAYGASRGMIHYDTGLYHAQSIRWIEEYGVVKGLGNLHCRLAYNSSSFALSALYSMAFLGGQSYHCTAGWLAFLLAAVCLPIGKTLRTGRFWASGLARVMCVYYLVNIFDEMISPASDYFMVLVAFYIVIKWLDLVEIGEEAVLPYGLLCVLGVFLMTVKLSAALILLLTVYPACRLLRERRWKETGVYLGLGLLTAVPFFIRNVLISGWLVYPFTQIDLFDVVWKIPKGLADYDAREIQVWGRGYTDVTQFDMPVREWLPGWLRTLAGSDKLLVTAAAAAVAVFLLEAVYLAWRRGSVVFPAFLTVQATVSASFVFWLCTSPLIRYGCVWVYLTAAVVFGGILDMVLHPATGGGRRGEKAQGGRGWRLAAGRVVSAFVILILVYKGFALAWETIGAYVNDYWLVQKDYENYETYTYRIEDVIFYCPVEGDRVGYEAFPSSPSEARIAFLGEEMAEGFRAVE